MNDRTATQYKMINLAMILIWVLLTSLWLGCRPALAETNASHLKQINSLDELWSYYKYTYIKDGRVISLDENNQTTSEGQGYAMLRAVWANDPLMFEQVFQWTKSNLMIRKDHLAAWKYKQDINSASDADTDMALALLLAAAKFSNDQYHDEAILIIKDIWNKEVVRVGDRCYMTAGNWAPNERYCSIHVGYLAPYAYELFAKYDHDHPWQALITSSYAILKWIYKDEKCALPPQIIYLDQKTGKLHLKHPKTKKQPIFSYDVFPLFWRVAMDIEWYGRDQGDLVKSMLAFFQSEWHKRHLFYDTYTLDGKPESAIEAPVLYATIYALALNQAPDLAIQIHARKLDSIWENALTGKDTPYYLHNWLWFSRALDVHAARNYTDFFDFLKPFDFKNFSLHFPWIPILGFVVLFGLLQFENITGYRFIKALFLICGFAICIRYIWWRIFHSLNFLEPLGPFISIGLLLAEIYCLTTVMFLVLQVGLKPRSQRARPDQSFCPWVDVFVPIYSESLEILEKTLIAAVGMDYEHKRIFILDDSHRKSVQELTQKYQATYIKGPKKHAKAGNLNHALSLTQGQFIVVFDTDHIPVTSFLKETIAYFADPKVGVVQTPHHFYNPDIFQNAFGCKTKIPNEQDMFNHGIQGARDHWQGAFFVGSGAVFNRKALEAIGGFLTMSVTEDIHSSQHIHAKGFKSVFVDKDLAVGLTAENVSSYIIQRQRWMQGCLQIFFKDNPLFKKGLGLRLRLGYFASLYYFFFPMIRIIFWATPLYYLLFHLHPIFSEVTVLLAYMLPYLICLPLLSAALLPKWPRMFWGVTYENAVCFPLFISMLALLLPGSLQFKVTPKGVTSAKRHFDLSSSAITLMATGITLFAIIKGMVEFSYFKIEKDAYFFNIGWAVYNFIFMAAALLVCWEKPQRRDQERVLLTKPFTLSTPDFDYSGHTIDISLSGMAFEADADINLPRSMTVRLFDPDPVTLKGDLVYCDRKVWGRSKCAIKFDHKNQDLYKRILQGTFACPQSWQHSHDRHTHSNILLGFYFFKGILNCLRPVQSMQRQQVRIKKFKKTTVFVDKIAIPAMTSNISQNGQKLIFTCFALNRKKVFDQQWEISDLMGRKIPARLVYLKPRLPFVYMAGFSFCALAPEQK